MIPVSPNAFPSAEELGAAFFKEAIRHLTDAHLLHLHTRYPAAIASSMKAAEMGVKAILMREGALGWWEKLQETHEPMTAIENHVILQRVYLRIESLEPGLPAQIKAMEKLAPNRPGARRFNRDEEANPEYPFVHSGYASVGAVPYAALSSPESYFSRGQSEGHYRSARLLLLTLNGDVPQLGSSARAMPPRLPRRRRPVSIW